MIRIRGLGEHAAAAGRNRPSDTPGTSATGSYDYRENGRSGRRIRVNLGTEDKRQAEQLKVRILEDMGQGRDPSLRVIKARPWRDVVEEFIEKRVGTHVKARRASARVLATRPCCVFRTNAITDSGGRRSLIPAEAGRDRAWGVLAEISLRPDDARSESQSSGHKLVSGDEQPPEGMRERSVRRWDNYLLGNELREEMQRTGFGGPREAAPMKIRHYCRNVQCTEIECHWEKSSYEKQAARTSDHISAFGVLVALDPWI